MRKVLSFDNPETIPKFQKLILYFQETFEKQTLLSKY